MKIVNFSETIAACDLKIDRCRLTLIEFLKVYGYSRSMAFLDLGPKVIYI